MRRTVTASVTPGRADAARCRRPRPPHHSRFCAGRRGAARSPRERKRGKGRAIGKERLSLMRAPLLQRSGGSPPWRSCGGRKKAWSVAFFSARQPLQETGLLLPHSAVGGKLLCGKRHGRGDFFPPLVHLRGPALSRRGGKSFRTSRLRRASRGRFREGGEPAGEGGRKPGLLRVRFEFRRRVRGREPACSAARARRRLFLAGLTYHGDPVAYLRQGGDSGISSPSPGRVVGIPQGLHGGHLAEGSTSASWTSAAGTPGAPSAPTQPVSMTGTPNAAAVAFTPFAEAAFRLRSYA